MVEKVGAKLRFRILVRDRFRCVYCGAKASASTALHVDHVIPRSQGGTNDPLNLVTACTDCNLGKGAVERWEDEDVS
jgi:5-methylcytosine-specific restriction endonuclease McrA